MFVFRSRIDGRHHLAFVKGKVSGEPTLVRVQSENVLQDVFRDMQGGGFFEFAGCIRENFPGGPRSGALYGAGEERVGPGESR